MAFHDIQLPDGFQYTSMAGAGFATVVNPTSSGHEVRIARQAQARHRFRLLKQLQSKTEAKALKAFALARRGSLHSFKLRDFSDYTSSQDGETAATNADQAIGIGDGFQTQFQLIKTYEGTGVSPYVRTIELPVSGSVVCALDLTPTSSFTVSSTGVVTFSSAPGNGVVITAGFQFYVPVRFELSFDQWCSMQADAFDVWSIPGLDCIEVLGEVENPERRHFGGQTTFDPVSSTVSLTLNDGALIYLNPTTAVSVLLPQTARVAGGPDLFTVAVKAGAAGTVQVRDDAGNAVGSALSAGTVKKLGLARNGATSTWVLH